MINNIECTVESVTKTLYCFKVLKYFGLLDVTVYLQNIKIYACCFIILIYASQIAENFHSVWVDENYKQIL